MTKKKEKPPYCGVCGIPCRECSEQDQQKAAEAEKALLRLANYLYFQQFGGRWDALTAGQREGWLEIAREALSAWRG